MGIDFRAHRNYNLVYNSEAQTGSEHYGNKNHEKSQSRTAA